jgi:hypothetical protein
MPVDQTSWLEQIQNELEKIEPEDDEWPLLTTAESPQYLKNAEALIARASAPSISWKRGDTLTASRLGGLLGHKIAYVKPFAEGLRIAKRFPPTTPADIVNAFREAEETLLAYHPVVLRTARRCIVIALRQPLRDAKEFMLGLSRALEKGSMDAHGSLIGATTATEFYWVLLCIGPRLLHEVRSVAHLHQLCRRWFGHRAGDLKTTEKRCERIKLRFGKPGRPTRKMPTPAV